MAAPKGNSFWKNRSKHGRDKLFESAELLWEAACEYFHWCDTNPLKSIEYHSGKRKTVPKMRAYTLHGFCLYVKANTDYWRIFKSGKHEDFYTVIKDIEDVIYNQKFEGAAAGLLNANIISRDLGLADKVDSTNSNLNYNVPLNKDEAREIAKHLEDEY